MLEMGDMRMGRGMGGGGGGMGMRGGSVGYDGYEQVKAFFLMTLSASITYCYKIKYI